MKFQTIFVEGKESWIRIGSDDKTTFFKQHPLLVHLDSEKKIKRSDMQQPFTLKKWKKFMAKLQFYWQHFRTWLCVVFCVIFSQYLEHRSLEILNCSLCDIFTMFRTSMKYYQTARDKSTKFHKFTVMFNVRKGYKTSP